MLRPVHFEIHADDPARARSFYAEIFGWTCQKWGDMDYWVVMTGEQGSGINGGLLPRQGPRPAADAPVNGFVLTVEVPDVDQSLADVQRLGGDVALPAQTMPGIGRLAYVHDSEGNLLGLLTPEQASG